MSPISASRNGSPPVTKISPTPSRGCFARDPPHPLRAERASRRFRRRAHAAIVAAQIAVEIRVEPKPRADRPIGLGLDGASPRRMTSSERGPLRDRVDQAVAGEAAPGLEIRSEARIGADDGKQLPVPAFADRRDQPGKQAVGEGHGADVDLEFRLHGRPAVTVRLRRRGSTVTRPLRRAGAALHEKSPQDCRKL